MPLLCFKVGLHTKNIIKLITMSKLKDIATQIRRDIVRMVHAVQSGHPGGSLGCTEYFTALYFKVMKHDPAFNMDGKDEDVFFLSNGPSESPSKRYWLPAPICRHIRSF